jgi:hypothetical protein
MKLQPRQNTILFPIVKVGKFQNNATYADIALRKNHTDLSTGLAHSEPPPRKPANHVHFEKGILVDFYG